MTPNQIKFSLHKRPNCYVKGGVEWALLAQLDDDNSWCLTTWERPPKDKEVVLVKNIALRAMEIYHASWYIPRFELNVIDGE